MSDRLECTVVLAASTVHCMHCCKLGHLADVVANKGAVCRQEARGQEKAGFHQNRRR